MNKKPLYVMAVLLVVVGVLYFFVFTDFSPDGGPKMASEIILTNANVFEKPETVRFISGCANLIRHRKGYAQGMLYARLEMEDAQGQRVQEDYVMCISYEDYKGHVVDREQYPNYYQNTSVFESQQLSAEEINMHLEKHWEKKGKP